MQNKKKEGVDEKNESIYINNTCKTCGQPKPRRKKRYILISILVMISAYLVKVGYERAFKKHIVMNLVEDILNSKTITSMNLSETTKAKLLYLAEIAAATPENEELDNMPGTKAHAAGLHAKHPIMIIPGIANTTLELWKTKKEHVSFFRKRIWGSHSTFTFMLHNRAEWLESMKLNVETGLDPAGRKVRASSGLDSSDFSIPGMWFWWKIIENLSHIGYDTVDIQFAAFDWRLGMEEIEKRDGYFTKLKLAIEIQKSMKKEKSVIIAHSLGSIVFHYFLQWVNYKDETWADEYIHSAIYIGPPLLGAPKTLGFLLSGDVKYTSDMGMIQYTLVELLFGREQRLQLVKTWGSPLYLLPKGGDRFWKRKQMDSLDLVAVREHKGNEKESRKDIKDNRKDRKNNGKNTKDTKDINDTYRFLTYLEIMDQIKSILPSHNRKIHEKLVHPKGPEDTWSNPLLSPLPNAPNMSIYTLYGVNKPTENGYYFVVNQETYQIDKNRTSEKDSVYKGVVLSDGDGTVPLVSMGYMGAGGWKSKKLNPHSVKTVVREYSHNPSKSFLDIREGAGTAEHVNILGNFSLISDILEICAGAELKDKIISNLPEHIKEIDAEQEKDPEQQNTKIA